MATEPTSAPSRPATQSLRDSCDNCYRAKIKCSKTKPDCERCVQRGLTCVYLPSRRRGRRKATAGGSASPKSPAHNMSTSSLDSKSSLGLNDYDMMESLPALTDCSMPASPAFGALDDSSLSSDSFFTSESADSSLWTSDPNPQPDIFADHHTSHFMSSIAATQAGFTPPNSADITPDGKGHHHFAHESFMVRLGSIQCDCEASCLEVLSLLSKSLGAWDAPSSFEAMTTINSRAVMQCSRALNCMTCLSQASNGSLALLLGTLLSKVIASYQSALFAITPMHKSIEPMQNEFMLDTTSNGAGHIPFDMASEKRLQLEILYPSIQRLQPLLGRFHGLCDRVSVGVAGLDVDCQPAELFQSLPEYLEDGFLNLTRLFQQQSRKWMV